MADIKGEIKALQSMIAELANRLEAESKPLGVKSRAQVQADVAKALAGTLGGQVKTVKGQTVIEADGQRFKVHVSGPHARIRAPGRAQRRVEGNGAGRPGAPATGGAAAS